MPKPKKYIEDLFSILDPYFEEFKAELKVSEFFLADAHSQNRVYTIIKKIEEETGKPVYTGTPFRDIKDWYSYRFYNIQFKTVCKKILNDN